jgi:hypothetical protein
MKLLTFQEVSALEHALKQHQAFWRGTISCQVLACRLGETCNVAVKVAYKWAGRSWMRWLYLDGPAHRIGQTLVDEIERGFDELVGHGTLRDRSERPPPAGPYR